MRVCGLQEVDIGGLQEVDIEVCFLNRSSIGYLRLKFERSSTYVL